MAATMALLMGEGGTEGVKVRRRRRLRHARRVVVLNWGLRSHIAGVNAADGVDSTSKETNIYRRGERKESTRREATRTAESSTSDGPAGNAAAVTR